MPIYIRNPAVSCSILTRQCVCAGWRCRPVRNGRPAHAEPAALGGLRGRRAGHVAGAPGVVQPMRTRCSRHGAGQQHRAAEPREREGLPSRAARAQPPGAPAHGRPSRGRGDAGCAGPNVRRDAGAQYAFPLNVNNAIAAHQASAIHLKLTCPVVHLCMIT